MEETKVLLNVLCLEDILKDAELLYEMLADAGFSVSMDIATKEKEYLSFLKARKYDVILADYTLPGYNVYDALKLALELQPEAPFICVSGTIGEDHAVELLKLGATNYILKDRMGKFVIAVRQALEGVVKKKELKQADEALHKSEYEFRLLAESMPQIVWIAEADGSCIYFNQQWMAYTGYTLEEGCGHSWVKPIHPDDLQLAGETWKHAIKNNTGFSIECRMRRKNGIYQWWMIKGVPVWDEQGAILKWFGTCTDINDLKQAEHELIKAKEHAEESSQKLIEQKAEIVLNNERLESLLRISQYQTNIIQELLDYALDEAIKLTDSEIGYIYYYNEATRQFSLNSWSKEAMKKCGVQNAQTLYDLDKTGFWGEAVRQRIPIVINDYQANNPQKKGIPEGHVKLLNFLTIPVIFDQQIVAVIGVANKATDYNNSDIRQLTLLMDTVWKFSERITLIDDLKFAKDKAEENDRLKSAFLANMSHEIRTPMNGILGFTGLLKKPELTGEKQQLYISMIEKGGARMLNIINDIISISKVESGQMEVSISESNVNEKLEFIYTFFKPEVQRKGMQMSFHTSLPAREAVIKTDREKVSAILTCLVKNAVEYTFSGTIEFGYVLKPVKKSGDNKDIASAELEFYVKDTGIGIPQDKMEAIFERFVQADNGDKRAYQGAGLGLSISKAYVEMLGGKIWVESEVGKGSTFYFTIPYHNEPKGIIAVEKVVAPDKEEPQIKKLKILITDDDESSAMLLTEIVKKYGKEFLYAENGVEASEACRNNPDLDLVLMDIQMPIMDGYEATKQIRQFNKKIVIIAQTAYVRDGDRAKAIDAGCNDYVSKPINHSLITELIKKYYKES